MTDYRAGSLSPTLYAWKGSEHWARVPALAVSQHALEMIKKQFESAPFTVGNSALLCPHRGANGRENREGHSSKKEGKQRKMNKNVSFPKDYKSMQIKVFHIYQEPLNHLQFAVINIVSNRNFTWRIQSGDVSDGTSSTMFY